MLRSLSTLDQDHDGKITVEEMKYFMDTFAKDIDPTLRQEIISSAPLDSSGKIDVR